MNMDTYTLEDILLELDRREVRSYWGKPMQDNELIDLDTVEDSNEHRESSHD
jgi:hypothetical protein